MKLYLNIIGVLLALNAIYIGMHLFVAWWLVRHFECVPPGTARLLFLLMALLLPCAMYYVRHWPGGFTVAVEMLTYAWMGVLFIWFCAAFAGTVAEFAAGFFAGRAEILFWGGRLTLGAVAALSVFAVFCAWRGPVLRRIEIPVKNLPAALDGFVIAELADIHLGGSVPFSRLEKTLRILSSVKPDMLAIAGDFVDPGFHDPEKLRRAAELLHFPAGKYGVFGNHEFYYGIPQAQLMYEAFGVKLLRGAAAELPGGLQIAGIDDKRAGHVSSAQVAELLAKLDPARPSVYLSHEPLDFDIAAAHGVSLMLSGHTHAGQIFPFNLFVRTTYKKIYGLFQNGGGWLYVTSGAGWWGPPMRLLTTSEIPVFTLRPAVVK
ncbi:MAG: metallophosphoesterase [Elusimicrobiales bacterium]